MPSPIPKPPEQRRRRNKVPGIATMAVVAPLGEIPELPPRGRKKWHEFTLAWWKTVQACEMREQFLESDLHGLYMLADLVDSYWKATRGKALLAGEIRLQGQRYGLSPLDRRRLQWEVRAEPAKDEELIAGVLQIDALRKQVSG